jgi:uncharacterized protein with WD repeat
MGGVGPSKSYPAAKGKGKKKRTRAQKGKAQEAAEARGSVLAEFETVAEYYDRDAPSVRLELDCLQHVMTVAGEEKFDKKKARDVTNAVARKTAGTYSAMTKYDFKEAMQSLDDEDEE